MDPPAKRTHAAKATVAKTRTKADHTTASAAERVKLKKRKDPALPTKARAKKSIKKNIKELLSEEEDPSEHLSERTVDDDDIDWQADDEVDEAVDETVVERDEGQAEDDVRAKCF